MTRDDHILLGTIAKTHGVRGELILRTTDPSLDLKEDRESIFLRIDGIMVPFFISSVRAFKAGEWILKLDWYETLERAESLVGYTVWISAERMEAVEDGGLSPDELVGFEFLDKNSGESGIIVDFMDIPDNPVFELESGGNRKLVPAREEFILEADPEKRLIVFKLPGGLI
jgi:16S rRNA processing protein RimM